MEEQIVRCVLRIQVFVVSPEVMLSHTLSFSCQNLPLLPRSTEIWGM